MAPSQVQAASQGKTDCALFMSCAQGADLSTEVAGCSACSRSPLGPVSAEFSSLLRDEACLRTSVALQLIPGLIIVQVGIHVFSAHNKAALVWTQADALHLPVLAEGFPLLQAVPIPESCLQAALPVVACPAKRRLNCAGAISLYERH